MSQFLLVNLILNKERVEYSKSPIVGKKEQVNPAAVHNAVSNASSIKRVMHTNFLKYYKDKQEVRVVSVDLFHNEPNNNNNLFLYKLSNFNKDL